MGTKKSEALLVLISYSLLMLAIFAGTASASDTETAELAGFPTNRPCNFSDCATEFQECRDGCGLLFDWTALSTLSLVRGGKDSSVTSTTLSESVFKESTGAKGATNDRRPTIYMMGAAQGVEPSGPGAIKPTNAEMPQAHWSRLPIWGPEAEARGHRVPLPFGVGFTYYDARQPVNVRDLKLGAGRGSPESSRFVKVGDPITSWQQNFSSRFDVWLFPFFNIYGVAGYTRGNTRGVVTITSPVFGLLNQDLPLFAEFHGPTVGGGATLAGGFRVTEWRDLHAFMIGDVNHTVTYMSFKNESLISHTKPRATVAAIRSGLRGEVTKYITISMWAGAMYQLIEEEVAGSVAGRSIEFVINQRAASPWNTLIGGQIEFGPHFNVVIEGGVGPRSSILTGATVRF